MGESLIAKRKKMIKKQIFLTRRARSVLSAALIVAFTVGPTILVAVSAQESKPYSLDEPIRLDFDMETISEPQEVETGYLYDWANGTIFQQVKDGFDLRRHLRAGWRDQRIPKREHHGRGAGLLMVHKPHVSP